MHNLWCLRVGVNVEADFFLTNSIVALGHPLMGNLSELKTKEEYKSKINSVYSDRSVRANGQYWGDLYRIKEDISKGDYVVFPSKDGFIYMGEVLGDYDFDNSFDPDYPHVRKVKWTKKFSRDILSQDAKYEIGSIKHCFKVKSYINEYFLHYSNEDFTIIKKSNLKVEDLNIDWDFFYKNGLEISTYLSFKYRSVSQYFSPDDVLQEAASKIIRNSIIYNSKKAKLSTFIFTILNSLYIDLSRGKLVKYYSGNLDSIDKNIIEGEDIKFSDVIGDKSVDIDGDVASNILIESLPNDCIEGDSFGYRDVIGLMVNGYDVRGIADYYNTSYNRVMSVYQEGNSAVSNSDWGKKIQGGYFL